MAESEHFDMVVIGCGPAGEKAAAQAAYFGKQVAVVDTLPVGGASAHTGTLPSKALRESALQFSGVRQLGIRGVNVSLQEDLTVQDLMAHKEFVSGMEVKRVLANLDPHGVELIGGKGKLTGPHTVEVALNDGGTRLLEAGVIVLSTGTSPYRPKNMPFESDSVFDSDQVLEMKKVPSSMIVYGAGVIGCEYAGMFAALGVKVTLVEPRDAILPFIDNEVADTLINMFQFAGMTIEMGRPFKTCTLVDAGVELRLEDDSVISAETLLFAAGRGGNTEGLGLESVGLEPNRRGLLVVNEEYQTQVPSIYAGGDIIGFPALASTSMEQGRLAVCHAFGFDYKSELATHLPYGIYTIPECAMVGESEKELKARSKPYEVGRAFYGENARGALSGGTKGMLKLTFSADDKRLLGVHIVGERASELVHIGLTVMQFGGTIDAFIDACYNYPTLSELYKYAAYDGLGRLKAAQSQ